MNVRVVEVEEVRREFFVEESFGKFRSLGGGE